MKIISGSALTNLLCFCLRDNFLFDIISHLMAFGTALQTGLGFYLSSSKRYVDFGLPSSVSTGCIGWSGNREIYFAIKVHLE